MSALLLSLVIGCAPESGPAEHGLAYLESSSSDDRLVFTAPGLAKTRDMTRALVDCIGRAEHSLDIAIYGFDLGLVANRILDAAERGVDVRIVGDEDEADHSLAILEAAGVELSLRKSGDHIMHHKFIVVDEARVWTGSTNWTTSGTTLNNNHAMVLESPTVAERYTEEFEQMWDGDFGNDKVDLGGDATAYLLSGGSISTWFSPQHSPADEVVRTIEEADRALYFMVFSFTRDDVAEALIDAHERGVEVIGIFDESQASSSYSQDDALAAAGVPIFLDGNEHNSGWSGGKLHHKLLVADPGLGAGTVLTGSMNWSNAGNDDNDENLVRITGTGQDRDFVREFCGAMEIAVLHDDYDGEAPDLPCRR